VSIAGLVGRELRARFACGERSALVDGELVAWEALSVRSMNFGQHWRCPAAVPCRYVLELPVQFFLEFLSEPDALPDLLREAKQHPDLADPLDQALIAAGFPTAERALQAPALAKHLVDFFAHDALARWLGDADPELQPGFVLNSCEASLYRPSTIRLEGSGRRSDSSNAYQDR
jgi:hypothetical protein